MNNYAQWKLGINGQSQKGKMDFLKVGKRDVSSLYWENTPQSNKLPHFYTSRWQTWKANQKVWICWEGRLSHDIGKMFVIGGMKSDRIFWKKNPVYAQKLLYWWRINQMLMLLMCGEWGSGWFLFFLMVLICSL